MKFRAIICLLFLGFLGCKESTSQNLPIRFSFHQSHKEISGMVWHSPNETLFALQDKGNKPEILVYNKDGKFLQSTKVNEVKNNDWEALTQDEKGLLYIGDFGNNKNDRTNLAIYQFDPESAKNQPAIHPTQITNFSYAEQQEFPPKKGNLLFDSEAFIEKDGYFYLFTKNRSKGFDGTFYIYQIPNQPGTFIAKKLAELKTCDNYRKCAITDATLTLDGDKVLLLTNEKVFEIPFGQWKQASLQETSLQHVSQKEAITFFAPNTLWIADEVKEKNNFGNVYEIPWPKN